MSQHLTFTDRDILNGALVLPNGAVGYTISTVKKWLGLKRAPTNVVSLDGSHQGSINWEVKTFTIDGVKRPIDALKKQVWDRNKDEWTWGDTSYTIRFYTEHGEWTARPTLGWTDVARLERRRNESPRPALSAELADETERMFMVLVLIFNEGVITSPYQ
ncbi:hypothetical protein B0H19DRAFT_1382590 [Mycena capillaripes]|nr:hypothetical protein B0H19DRAFT_1382590 [Mycena capillaripes]